MMWSNVFSNMFDDMMYGMPMMESAHHTEKGLMNCDVKEYDDHYELDMDLAGYRKEDIKAELKDGYLTVKAERNENHDENDADGHVIRRERFTGTCTRSFYVGDHVSRENVSAAYENGVLRLSVPKKQLSEAPEMKYIEIA